MIANGDFEQPWQSNHNVVVRSDKAYMETRENIFTPEGWWSWFRHVPGTWDQPEVRIALVKHDPVRVHTGNAAVLLFTFYRAHDAGLLQQVPVEPGKIYRLGGWAHAWSNHDDISWCTDIDNPRSSSGVGKGAAYWTEGSILLTGDPRNDAKSNFTFRMGVCTQGGVDPFAPSVVWGPGAHIYNVHAQVPAITFTAQGPVATIFIRSTTRWAFKHNDAYFDDITLEQAGSECRGIPREQYERTYVLMHPTANAATVKAIVDSVWDGYRVTIGGSADDACIGDLDYRRVIATNPTGWPSDLGEFVQTHYPGVEYVSVEDSTATGLANKVRAVLGGVMPQPPDGVKLELTYPTTYLPAVITQPFTATHRGIDLRSSWKYYQSEVLAALDATVVEVGWTDTFGRYILTRTVLDTGETAELRYAHLVADGVYVQVGSVVAAGQKLGRADGTANPPVADHLHFSVRVAGTYIDPAPLIKWPADPVPTPVVPRNYVGLHLQTMVAGWNDYVAAVDAPCKVLASMQDVYGAKSVRSDMPVVWRHVTNNYGDTLEHPDPMVGARRWVDKFRDSLYIECDRLAKLNLTPPYFYVESVNEVYPPTLRARDFDMAFIRALAETGLPVAPLVMTAAVGNPHEADYGLLVDLGRLCAQHGGAFGYHAYWYANPQESGLVGHWKWLAGRWTEMDKVLVANGVRVKWCFTEMGAVGGQYVAGSTSAAAGQSFNYVEHAGIRRPSYIYIPQFKEITLWDKFKRLITGAPVAAQAVQGGYVLLPIDGWRSSKCYNGDWTRYYNDFEVFNNLTATSVAGREGRVLGGTVFTSGIGVGWNSFQLGASEFAQMKTLNR